jgi:uncharacterized membrane protein
MESPASVANHPLHPILVPLPIGLWVFSLACDLIYAVGWGGAIWDDVAFYAMAGGLIGAFKAAVPGLLDYWSLTDPSVKKVATLHMGTNLVVMALVTVNLWVRAQYSATVGVPLALSVMSILLLGVTGWLGGELVYVHGVGVEPQHDIARMARAKRKRRKMRLV